MPVTDDSSASYSRDQKVIEHRLNEIDKGQDRLWKRLDEMGTDLTAIKTQLKIEPRLRGGMFGVAGGSIVIGLVEIIKMLIKGGAG